VSSKGLRGLAEPRFDIGHAARFRKFQKGLETILVECLRWRRHFVRSYYTTMFETEDRVLDYMPFDTVDDPALARRHWTFASNLEFRHTIAESARRACDEVPSDNLRAFILLVAARLPSRLEIQASSRIYTSELRKELAAREAAETASA
jgi:hypothetical protein